MRSVVIVPTYNERDYIDALLADLLALPSDVACIVVDDNSPDGTGKRADEWAVRDPRVRVIHRPRKMGLGTAHVAGFRQALADGFDRVLTMDADYSHHPRYIPALVALSEDRDLVIGSRYVPGGGTRFCSLSRRALSRGANVFARRMLGLRASDCTAGFRCYNRQALASIDLDSLFSNGYSFLIEMIYRVQRKGWTIGEVPIVFEDRRHGTSKISHREVYQAIYTVLRLSRDRLRDKRSGRREW